MNSHKTKGPQHLNAAGPKAALYFFLPEPAGAGLVGVGRWMVSTTWVEGLCWACLTEVNSPVFALRPIFMIDFLSAIGIESRADLKPDQIVANFASWRSVLRSVPTRPGNGSGHRAEVAASAFCCLG